MLYVHFLEEKIHVFHKKLECYIVNKMVDFCQESVKGEGSLRCFQMVQDVKSTFLVKLR